MPSIHCGTPQLWLHWVLEDEQLLSVVSTVWTGSTIVTLNLTTLTLDCVAQYTPQTAVINKQFHVHQFHRMFMEVLW